MKRVNRQATEEARRLEERRMALRTAEKKLLAAALAWAAADHKVPADGGPGTDAEVRAETALVWLKDAARRLYHANKIMKNLLTTGLRR